MLTLLHLETENPKVDGEMRLKMKGSGHDIARMVATAMDSNPSVEALFITAVLGYAVDKNIPFSALRDIYNKHKNQ
jgi:hypothetical protein